MTRSSFSDIEVALAKAVEELADAAAILTRAAVGATDRRLMIKAVQAEAALAKLQGQVQ